MEANDVPEYALRCRTNSANQPLGQLCGKQRELQAAFEVLKGAISPRSAKSKYQVNKDSLCYYKRRLVADGVAATIAAATPAAPAPGSAPTTAEDEKENAAKTDEWDAYCKAYVRAGELVKEGVSKREAAKRASTEFKVNISPTTALRAAERPGQVPSKPGRQLILSELIEHRLEMLCLVLLRRLTSSSSSRAICTAAFVAMLMPVLAQK